MNTNATLEQCRTPEWESDIVKDITPEELRQSILDHCDASHRIWTDWLCGQDVQDLANG